MNYSKLSRLFVCQWAMLLAIMFAACSDDHVAGGVTEETRVYTLAGRVGDVYPKLLNVADSTGGPVDSLKYENSVFAEKGSIITIYELDSLTLDTTGLSYAGTVDNDSGHFAFKEMNLRSPYVLIRKFDNLPDTLDNRGVIVFRYYHYSAIVDLRNVKNINVNTLTSMKVPLVQEYVAEGKSFAEANKKAEREILEGFGIYDDLGSFEEMVGEESELSYVNKIARLEDDEMRLDVENVGVKLSFLSPKYFSKSATTERHYLNSMKMISYEIGYLAHQDSLGRCTESRENETAELKGYLVHDLISIVCRSGKWSVGFKTVDYTKGTMTDNRDGKTYKTVTYNFGTTPQTWMAENLDFADTTSLSVDSSLRVNLSGSMYCYRESYVEKDDNECSVYGHEYQWRAAMNIGIDEVKTYSVGAQGDSLLVSKRCIDAYFDDSDLDSVTTVRDSCDTLLLGKDDLGNGPTRTVMWNYTDYITPSNQNSYQGVCPDGWRIPTMEDWITLLQNLGEQYGVYYGNVVPVLYDETATGFGMNAFAEIVGVELDRVVLRRFKLFNCFIMADASYYVAEFFNQWWSRSGFDLSIPDISHHFLYKYNIWKENPESLPRYPSDPYRPAAVRCIKN